MTGDAVLEVRGTRCRAVLALAQRRTGMYPLVCAGFFLLTGSGLLLSPDILGDPVAWVKQVMVHALLNNGVAVRGLSVRLRALRRQHGAALRQWDSCRPESGSL